MTEIKSPYEIPSFLDIMDEEFKFSMYDKTSSIAIYEKHTDSCTYELKFISDIKELFDEDMLLELITSQIYKIFRVIQKPHNPTLNLSV